MAGKNKRSDSPQTRRNSVRLCEKLAEQEKKESETELIVLSSSSEENNKQQKQIDQGENSNPKTPHESEAESKRKLSNFKFCAEYYEKRAHPVIKRNIFSPKNDCYINYQPMNLTGIEGITDGVTIPEYFPLSIKPFPYLIMNDLSASFAAYIFIADEENQYGEEILAKTELRFVAYRKTLKSLMPNCWVDQEVINLLCCKLTQEERCVGKLSVWYLPTTFSQYAFDWERSPTVVRKRYEKDFFDKIENARKIFIPINDQGVHWYLMVVDFVERKIYLLDSLPCATRKLLRRRDVLRVALFLEEMFIHDSFYDCGIKLENHLISNFPIVEPRGLPRQRYGSNDCGVFVATWMKECSWLDYYDCVEVRPDSRIKLAIDLVDSSYNEMKGKVIERANKHWMNMEKMRNSIVKQ